MPTSRTFALVVSDPPRPPLEATGHDREFADLLRSDSGFSPERPRKMSSVPVERERISLPSRGEDTTPGEQLVLAREEGSGFYSGVSRTDIGWRTRPGSSLLVPRIDCRPPIFVHQARISPPWSSSREGTNYREAHRTDHGEIDIVARDGRPSCWWRSGGVERGVWDRGRGRVNPGQTAST